MLGFAQKINEATTAYLSVIPEDRYSEPYMPLQELGKEITKVLFFGYEERKLLGVAGYQQGKDVTLVRHMCSQNTKERKASGAASSCASHTCRRLRRFSSEPGRPLVGRYAPTRNMDSGFSQTRTNYSENTGLYLNDKSNSQLSLEFKSIDD